jgi:quercetin dioxygenase-like cupin family protein
MKMTSGIFCLAWLAPSLLLAQQASVMPLMSKNLPEVPGKEGVMITVVYPPGGSEPIHRHNAYVFVYVVEGSVVMQVRGGKEVTLNAGETFYEAPADVHVIGRNASKDRPARFVAFLLKDKGAPTHILAK